MCDSPARDLNGFPQHLQILHLFGNILLRAPLSCTWGNMKGRAAHSLALPAVTFPNTIAEHFFPHARRVNYETVKRLHKSHDDDYWTKVHHPSARAQMNKGRSSARNPARCSNNINLLTTAVCSTSPLLVLFVVN